MKRLGLADGLGIVAALVALAWIPVLYDPFTPGKLLVLAVGGGCMAPAVINRWRVLGRPSWPVLLPCASAVLLLLWGLISIVATRAPIWDSLFGWWGRGDGWLALLGAVVLLLGAASLSMREVMRTITWLLAGATIVAIVGLLQFAGMRIAPGIGGPVVGFSGNIDFAAAHFAIIAVLALGRAVSRAPRWERIWGGLVFLVLAFLAWRTTTIQGPAALGAGLAAFAIAGALLNRGRHRRAGLIAAGAIVALGASALILFAFASGPLAGLWNDGGFKGRQVYWEAAVRMMAGEPVFGTGPSGFARYISEYRPPTYISATGPVMRVSAAHNVPLQFGATLGYVGLILWIAVFAGASFALVRRIIRLPVASIGVSASVAAALAVYVVQAMVSIDMLPLLATGWLVAGLAIACAREPDITPMSHPEPGDRPPAGRWVPITGGVLGLVIALLVGTQISLGHRLTSGIASNDMLSVVTNPMTPCVIRSQLAQQLPLSFSPGISGAVIMQTTEIDRRCPTLVHFAAEVAVRQRMLDLAGSYTGDAVAFDPLLDSAWVLRGRYFLGAGDFASAEAAAREARRVQALYPANKVDPISVAQIADLEQTIEQARAKSGGQEP